MSALTDLFGLDDAEFMSDPRRNCAIPADFDPKTVGHVADQWHPSAIGERAATQLCRGCPQLEACREYAMARPELEGVWGGTTTNQRRGVPGPSRAPKTHCKRGHELTDDNILANGKGTRTCRTCRARKADAA